MSSEAVPKAIRSKRAFVSESTRRGAFRSRAGAVVSKAVILAGGDSTSLGVLTDVRPKPLLPVLDRPLLEWQLQALARSGIEEVGIALSRDNVEPVSRYLATRAASPIRIHCAVDEVPRGPAGGMKHFESVLEGETFLVVDGGTFLGDVRIDALVKAHHARRAKVTLAILPPPEITPSPEAVVSADGEIQRISHLHRSSDRRRSRPLTGLCVFDASALELVPDEIFFDVKERLFTELQNRGALVAAESARGLCVPIDSLHRYYRLQAELLEGDFLAGSGHRQVADGVWIGEGAELSPSAYVLGPVVIGSQCRIAEGAQVVGPAAIGSGSHVGPHSVVRGSFLWDGVRLASRAKVENSIVAAGTTVPEETWVRSSVLVPSSFENGEPGRAGQILPSAALAPVVAGGAEPRKVAGKALFDFVASAALLVLSSPFLLLCALAVRVDSKGPVIFRQRRCGKGGRPFWMFKFRTMTDDADQKQAELKKQNDTDGPVFKMVSDPRVTRVGRLLRRTSLDELPQLLNVLRGEMSLVGPRPLAAEEMRYCPAWRDRRLGVKPGITGLWQVSGRSGSKFHDWIRHDIDYVKRQSMALDLWILAKTLVVVFRRSGAY